VSVCLSVRAKAETTYRKLVYMSVNMTLCNGKPQKCSIFGEFDPDHKPSELYFRIF